MLFCKLLNFRRKFLVHKNATFNTQQRWQILSENPQNEKLVNLIAEFLNIKKEFLLSGKIKLFNFVEQSVANLFFCGNSVDFGNGKRENFLKLEKLI